MQHDSRFSARRSLAGCVAAVLAVSLGWAASGHAADADARFEELAGRFIKEFPAYSPVGATQLGDHRFDHLLDEATPEARAREAAFCRQYQQELEQLPAASLSKAHQVDRALLAHQLASQLWHLETFQEWAWNPTVYTGIAGGAVYNLMAREFAPLPERLGHVADRLELYPRLMQQARATLVPARVPKVHAETAIKQNAGLLSLLDEMVKPGLGKLEDAPRARLEKAMDTARAAIRTQQEWLEKELLPKAAGDFRIGSKLFDQRLAFSLHTPMSRADVRKAAEREYRRVRDEMFDVSREIYRKQYPMTQFETKPSEAFQQAVIRAAIEVACQQLPRQEELDKVARQQLDQATAFVRSHQLVTLPPDPVEVILMPEFQRGVAFAYCDSPGALDAGQKTFYAVSPTPADWTPEQVRSFLREYNLYSMQDLTMHEAMPGHYLQIAHANRYPSRLRAVLASGTFIEGWAVYAEQMMVKEGYLEHDPLLRLINLKWYLRAVGNAILDQRIHCEGMTRDEAMRFMVEGTFQEEREAAGKWTRAQLTSTQLSTYFVGFQEHIALRREVEKAQSSRFSLRQYHDQLLSYGSPPIPFVRALMLDLPVPAKGR